MNFTVTHGDTWQFYGDIELDWPLGCTTCDTIAFDLTGYTVTAHITRSSDSCQRIPLSVTVEDAIEGKIHVYLDASISEAMARGTYIYEVLVTSPDLVFTAFTGQVQFV